jgi:hypothetical protein
MMDQTSKEDQLMHMTQRRSICFYVGLIINILFQKRFLLDIKIIKHIDKGVQRLQLYGLKYGVCTLGEF